MKYYTLLTQFIQQKAKIIYGNFPILQCFVKTAIWCVNKIYTPYNTLPILLYAKTFCKNVQAFHNNIYKEPYKNIHYNSQLL